MDIRPLSPKFKDLFEFIIGREDFEVTLYGWNQQLTHPETHELVKGRQISIKLAPGFEGHFAESDRHIILTRLNDSLKDLKIDGVAIEAIPGKSYDTVALVTKMQKDLPTEAIAMCWEFYIAQKNERGETLPIADSLDGVDLELQPSPLEVGNTLTPLDPAIHEKLETILYGNHPLRLGSLYATLFGVAHVLFFDREERYQLDAVHDAYAMAFALLHPVKSHMQLTPMQVADHAEFLVEYRNYTASISGGEKVMQDFTALSEAIVDAPRQLNMLRASFNQRLGNAITATYALTDEGMETAKKSGADPQFMHDLLMPFITERYGRMGTEVLVSLILNEFGPDVFTDEVMAHYHVEGELDIWAREHPVAFLKAVQTEVVQKLNRAATQMEELLKQHGSEIVPAHDIIKNEIERVNPSTIAGGKISY